MMIEGEQNLKDISLLEEANKRIAELEERVQFEVNANEQAGARIAELEAGNNRLRDALVSDFSAITGCWLKLCKEIDNE